MKDETKNILKYIGIFGLVAAGVGAVAVACSCVPKANINVAKAENDDYEEFKYSFTMKTHSGQINEMYDLDTGVFNDYVYYHGQRYDNVGYFYIAESLGEITLYRITEDGTPYSTVLNGSTESFIYVPRFSDAFDIQYGYRFNKYDLNIGSLDWISNPYLSSYFDTTYILDMPVPVIKPTDENYGYITIYNGLFYSNGVKYSKIEIRVLQLSGYVFSDDDLNVWQFDNTHNSTYASYKWVAGMYYTRYSDSQRVTVYQPNGVQHPNGAMALSVNYRWNGDGYRHIDYFGTTGKPNSLKYPNVTYVQLLQSINYGTPIKEDADLTNVFALIALTISSILPILNLQIASGLTLGVLLLLPVLVGCILALIKLVKK